MSCGFWGWTDWTWVIWTRTAQIFNQYNQKNMSGSYGWKIQDNQGMQWMWGHNIGEERLLLGILYTTWFDHFPSLFPHHVQKQRNYLQYNVRLIDIGLFNKCQIFKLCLAAHIVTLIVRCLTKVQLNID